MCDYENNRQGNENQVHEVCDLNAWTDPSLYPVQP